MPTGPAPGEPGHEPDGPDAPSAVPLGLEQLLDISVEHNDGAMPVVRLAGELDIASAATVTDKLAELLDRGTGVVLDLAQLRFIDSTGLTVLVRARRRAKDLGQELVLRRPTARVAKVLAIAGLDQVFQIET